MESLFSNQANKEYLKKMIVDKLAKKFDGNHLPIIES
jgi:hypothetical protein